MRQNEVMHLVVYVVAPLSATRFDASYELGSV
jgi:hypothetical protein